MTTRQSGVRGVRGRRARPAEASVAKRDGDLIEIPGGLSAVRGVRSAGVACGLKKSGDPDLALVVSEMPATVAATSP